MRLTRRHFLAAAALVAGAGAVAGGTAWRWWDQDPAQGYVHLSADEAAFFDALAEAIFPTGGDPALGGREAGVAAYVDHVLQGMAPTQRDLLRLAVHAFDNLARAYHGAPLSTQSLADAQDTVRRWTDHPIFEVRGVFQSFYIFATMAYLAHPAIAPRLAPSFNCGFGP